MYLLLSTTDGCVDTDTSGQCPGWASRGECASNPGYMHDKCKKSCEQCGGSPVTTKPSKPSPPKPTKPGELANMSFYRPS